MIAPQRNGSGLPAPPAWPFPGMVPVRKLRIDLRWRLRAGLREHALFLGGVTAYWLTALAAGAPVLSAPAWALLLGTSIYGVLVVTDLAATGVEQATRTRLPRLPAAWFRRCTRDPVEALRIVMGASGIIAVLLTFGAAKPLIGRVGRYRWDGLFGAWDRVLHGGTDPWVLTHALPGGAVMSLLLDRIYLGWYPVLVIACIAALLVDRPALRQQYLLSLLVIWSVAGTAMAFALASGGPIFYQAFTGVPGSFAPFAAELARLELWAPALQQKLLAVHLAGEAVPFSGISAMPSVHVAGAALVCLLAVRLHPKLAVVGLLYWLVIMMGSVHLGWHYAVDGYVGTAFALLSWWITGLLARSWLVRPGAAGYARRDPARPRRAAQTGGAFAKYVITMPGSD